MSIQSLTASLFSGEQQTNLGLATLNFDFSLIKVAAPEEFMPVGQQLAPRRLKNAESGTHHITARKLGALFHHLLPATPHLIKAYGTRASEIISTKSLKPEESKRYGIFSEHVGVDATNIWAAATSGPESIAVHLLACILARLWEGREAISIWMELVAERKKELEKVQNTEPGYEACWMASQVSLSREQLAEWDASARAWLRTADEAMTVKQRQLMLMLESVGLSVNREPALYQSVVHAWKSAMKAADDLIKGILQSIQSGSVLLGLSSWHIYPDMLVLKRSPTTIWQNDQLVHNGGILTIGLHMENEEEDRGVFWSLPLGQLRYYGGPIMAEKSLIAQGDRISLTQLFQVVADVLEVANLFVSLWEYVSQFSREYTEIGTPHWLAIIHQALEHLSTEDDVTRNTCRKLVQFR